MRKRYAGTLAALLAVGTLQAAEYITYETLESTLAEAQSAAEASDYARAFVLYRQAAQWGHKGSQYVLGELYLRGKGVERDAVLGTAWLGVAAEAPDQEFRRAWREAERGLTAVEKAQAEDLSERLSSAYGMEAAGIRCRTEMRTGSNLRVVDCTHARADNGDLIVPDQEQVIVPAS